MKKIISTITSPPFISTLTTTTAKVVFIFFHSLLPLYDTSGGISRKALVAAKNEIFLFCLCHSSWIGKSENLPIDCCRGNCRILKSQFTLPLSNAKECFFCLFFIIPSSASTRSASHVFNLIFANIRPTMLNSKMRRKKHRSRLSH